MKSYKLIKQYPGSGELGRIITDTIPDFFKIFPDKYPDLWERIPNKVYIKSTDGVYLHEGEVCWVFNTNCTVTNFIINKIHLNGNISGEIFSSREAAEKYLVDEIMIVLEDTVVEAKNIPIFSLLPKNGWDEKETTSLELWKRIKMGRNIANWKYFSSEADRDAYITLHKPNYSTNQVIQACRINSVPTKIYLSIIKTLHEEY